MKNIYEITNKNGVHLCYQVAASESEAAKGDKPMCDKTDDEITTEAVQAALAVLDAHLPDGAISPGPLGDALANRLHAKIKKAIALYRNGAR